jgi:hypothetical protein
MNRSLAALLLAFLAGGSIQAYADDTNTARPVVPPKKMMKECMDKERSNNSGASEEDMKKTCREKIKSYDQHPSETNPPPDNPGGNH